jgi:hypothetical protein
MQAVSAPVDVMALGPVAVMHSAERIRQKAVDKTRILGKLDVEDMIW